MKKPKIKTQTIDFKVYKPETAKDKNGNKVIMRLCEELVNGRWEPFYSYKF